MFDAEADAIARAQDWADRTGLPVSVLYIEDKGFAYVARGPGVAALPRHPRKASQVAILRPRPVIPPEPIPPRPITHTARIAASFSDDPAAGVAEIGRAWWPAPALVPAAFS